MKISAEQIHEIAQELENGMKVYLNKDNLEIKTVLDWDDIDIEPWNEDLDELDRNWKNFIAFTKMESWEAFKVMEGFIGEIEDEVFCEGLVKILNRKSPFANFGAEIKSSPYRQMWFDFKLRRYEEYVRSIIEAESFEDEELEMEEFEGDRGEADIDDVKTIDFIHAQIKNFVRDIRPPKEIRDRLDIGFSFDNSAVELFEIRPHFESKNKIVHSSFAKAKFIKGKNCWKIYWMRANGKWELYQPNPEVDHIKDFFALVNEDKHNCFKG